MTPEPVKRLECGRCHRSVNPVHARYLWLMWGERGACEFGEPGNKLFGRARASERVVLCGPCGDQFREGLKLYLLGGCRAWLSDRGLDSFARGVVRG